MSRMEKNTLVEIQRINELMVRNSNSKELLTEQVKAVDDVIAAIMSPETMKKYMKRFGMNMDIPAERFRENFKKLLTLLDDLAEGSSKQWDEMIEDAVDTKVVPKHYLPDGSTLPFEKWKDISLFEMDDLIAKGEVIEVVTFYKRGISGAWEEITEKMWKELMAQDELYNSLPSYLRLPAAQLTRRLSDTFGDSETAGIKSLKDFLQNLQVFFKDNKVTKDLSRAVIKLMSNDPKFSKTFADMLMSKVRFKNQLKLSRYTDTLDDFYKALSKDLDLPMDGPFMKKMMIQLSEQAENLARWFEFLWMKTKPMKLVQNIWFGVAFKSWKSTGKTIFIDIFASGFWNWVLGVGFMKPFFRKVSAVYGGTAKLSKLWTIDNVGRVILQAIGFYVMIGSIKSLKHMDIHQTYGWLWMKEQVDEIMGVCTGKSKKHDALTGQFYANASTVTRNESGEIINTCKGAELQPEFIKQFKLPKEVVKTKAEAIYAALNATAHDDSPWNLDIDFTIPIIDVDVDVTVPSLTLVFTNYLDFYEIDRGTFVTMFFDVEADDNGMDIFKMSQVANYYENEFDASLIEDVVNLNNWAKTLGAEFMSHADFITRLEKMPYLNHGDLKKVYNSFDDIVTENQKHLLAYPRFVKALDNEGYETTIFLNKCCESDCKCPAGCNIGGALVESDMGVALEEKLNVKVQADWKGKTFEQIKKVFDGVYEVSSTNKCFLNPSPKGDAQEAPTWDCEEVLGEKKCVKKTDGSGHYKQLSLCQYECTNE